MGGALSHTGGAQAVVDFRRLGDRDSVAPTKRFGAPNRGGAGRIARFGSPLPRPDSPRRQ